MKPARVRSRACPHGRVAAAVGPLAHDDRRHLFQVAERMRLEQELVRTLNERMVVGAVGPTCHAILQVPGVRVQVMPEHPKMGPLIVSLMRHLERKGRSEPATPSTPVFLEAGT